MNEVRKNGVRVVRANSKELDRIFALFAAAQEVRMAEQQMEARLRAIPGGWRDLRLIRTLLDKLTTNLVCTLQSEKLVSMRRMLPRMKFRVVCGTEATRVQEDEVILAMKDMDMLVHFAHEGNCKLCLNPDCRACPLGKTLDSVLTFDRDGCGWDAINIDEVG